MTHNIEDYPQIHTAYGPYIDVDFIINSNSMFLARLNADNAWWLISSALVLPLLTDTSDSLGPFDSWEAGVVYAKLMADIP